MMLFWDAWHMNVSSHAAMGYPFILDFFSGSMY